MAAARLLLATGLLVSAALVAAVGGGWGVVLGLAQTAAAVWILVRPRLPGPVLAAMIPLVVVVVTAARHWTARLPGACKCARLPHPPPGLVSVTGLAVALDLALIGLALWMAAASRGATMEKSSP